MAGTLVYIALDVTFNVTLWTAKTLGYGIYNGFSYLLSSSKEENKKFNSEEDKLNSTDSEGNIILDIPWELEDDTIISIIEKNPNKKNGEQIAYSRQELITLIQQQKKLIQHFESNLKSDANSNFKSDLPPQYDSIHKE